MFTSKYTFDPREKLLRFFRNKLAWIFSWIYQKQNKLGEIIRPLRPKTGNFQRFQTLLTQKFARTHFRPKYDMWLNLNRILRQQSWSTTNLFFLWVWPCWRQVWCLVRGGSWRKWQAGILKKALETWRLLRALGRRRQKKTRLLSIISPT